MAIGHNTKVFHSGMVDAPALTPAAGGIINVLDACLCNGFNQKTLTSLTVSGGVATATVSGGHGYSQYAVIEISGSSISELNGQHRVATVPNSTTFTFDATGIANGSATGTITCKVAGAGWIKAFSGSNKAAYNSATSDSGFYFRIDDSGAYSSGQPVRGYESMSDVDTGTRAFPTAAQRANFNWLRSQDASGDRVWALVADDKFFYFFIRVYAAISRAAAFYFGDIVSLDHADTNACIIGAAPWSAPEINNFSTLCSYNNTGSDKYIASAFGEYGIGSTTCGVYSLQIDGWNFLSINPAYYTASTLPNSGLVLQRAGLVAEASVSSTNAIRGYIPGYYCALVKKDLFIPSGIYNISLVDAKPFLLVNVNNNSADNLIAIDLGDWR